MEVFSQDDYYPIPSDKVISFIEQPVTKKKKSISKCNIYSLIVQLTSPLDVVDYNFFADFFLIYRNFILPFELYENLIARFNWCTDEISSNDSDRSKIGKIVIIRTFVLLRHSILNHFQEDFLVNTNVRLLFLHFLNSKKFNDHYLINSLIVSLKKIWIAQMEECTVDYHISDKPTKSNVESWINYEIKDFNEDSKLSKLAINRISNPDFRNKSVLSLYNEATNKFKLPNSKADSKFKLSRRTPTMLLFPQNTLKKNTPISNIDNNDNTTNETTATSQNNTTAHASIGSHSSNLFDKTRKISHLSKLTHMSTVIKDVDIPTSPKIDRIIPPTPAKKVEFILDSIYLPEDIQPETENNKKYATNSTSDEILEQKSHESLNTSIYKGALGLLAKWKKNHVKKDTSSLKWSSNEKMRTTNPEMDNFVKYVISITSLDTGNKQDASDLLNSVSSKFDILSARTIDEVEYLVSLENELLQQVNKNKYKNDIFKNSSHQNDSVLSKPVANFSAMDNLDLYQTVSSLAQSVISLSNTLNNSQTVMSNQKDRRQVKSSTVALLSSSSSKFNLVQNRAELNDNGPQRLVFHDSTEHTFPKTMSFNSNLNLSYHVSSTQKHFSPSKARYSISSPLKQLVTNMSDSSLSENSEAKESLLSGLSDDNQNTESFDESDLPKRHNLKKRNSFNNLREFTFEKEKAGDISIGTVSTIDLNSTNSTPIKGEPDIVTETAVKPASGRISIVRRASINKRPISRTSKSNVTIDPDFMRKDNILHENELRLETLEEYISKRDSVTPSVATSKLFNSRQNSPKKLKTLEATTRVRLSVAPSINSIRSAGSSFNSNFSLGSSPTKYETLRERFQKDLTHSNNEFTSGTSNKYFFSPDTGSLDGASPAKDVELLKNKFLNSDTLEEKEDEDESLSDIDFHSKSEKLSIVEGHNKSGTISHRSEINESKLKDFADLPDDSIHDDPISVAMMKLEGIYSKTGKLQVQSSPNISNLTRELEVLNTVELPSNMPTTPSERRRSLLIERRRQTLMNIPFTPPGKNAFDDSHVITPTQVQKLLSSYDMQDHRLSISNNDDHTPFILMYDSISIAQQMTLIEKELLREIDWKDLLDLNIQYKGPNVTSWLQLLIRNEALSGIDLAIARFNLTVDWIVSEIALTNDIKMRRNTIQRFIHVAEHCKNFQNYNTLMQIILALSSTTVQKFVDAWRLIEPGDLLTWEELKYIPSLDRNYHSIRNLLNSVEPLNGCIPFIVVYLSDLSLNSEKRDYFDSEKMINYNKFDTNVQIVKHFIQRVQWSKFYNFEADHQLLSKCLYITALSEEEINTLSRG